MELKDEILQILEQNRGDAVSGAALAKKLGVSRNAVWKCINKLKEEGVSIEAATNRGYCLASDNSLSAAGIIALLGESCFKIKTEQRVTSTNDVLKAEAQKGAPQFSVLVASEQTAGRGRLGRSFVSPEKTGIYLSVILRPQMKAEDALSITTAAAVAVARAIDNLKNIENIAKIKWVNDIYLEEKKVCGILTEAAIDFNNGQLEYAVLGLGINLLPSDTVSAAVGERAGFVFKSEKDAPENLRNLTVALVLRELERALSCGNNEEIIAEYRRRSLLDGRKIELQRGGECFLCTAIGIDDKARLVVRKEDGSELVVSSGEVSRLIV